MEIRGDREGSAEKGGPRRSPAPLPSTAAEGSLSFLEPWLSQALTCLPHCPVLPLHLASSPTSVLPQIPPFSLWKGEGRAQRRPRGPLSLGCEEGEDHRRRDSNGDLREETRQAPVGGLERDRAGQKTETGGDKDPTTSRGRRSLEAKRPKSHTQRGERDVGGPRLGDLLKEKAIPPRRGDHREERGLDRWHPVSQTPRLPWEGPHTALSQGNEARLEAQSSQRPPPGANPLPASLPAFSPGAQTQPTAAAGHTL